MDPTTCLKELIELIVAPERDNSEVREKIDDLVGWLEKDGAKPVITPGYRILYKSIVKAWSLPLYNLLFS
jgi:hypothetical protein